LIPLIARFFQTRSNVANAIERTDGSAAIFLNNQSHDGGAAVN
jgi:hypothetical protein